MFLPSKALAASTRWAQSSGPSAPESGRGMRAESCSCCLFLSCSSSELSGAERSPGGDKGQSKPHWRALYHVSHDRKTENYCCTKMFHLSETEGIKSSLSVFCFGRLSADLQFIRDHIILSYNKKGPQDNMYHTTNSFEVSFKDLRLTQGFV